jgi:predicted small secreted protein
MQRVWLMVMLIAVSGLLSACSNTFNGMGRDIENAGQSIQRSTQ